MTSHKYLLLGGGIMFLAACFSLLFSSPYHAFADVSCDASHCFATDTTLSDFVQGTFYAAGLSNVGDGAVQLMPMGLTALWVTDTYHLPGVTPSSIRKELAAVIYRDIIYVIGGVDGSNQRRNEIYSATTYITGPIKAPGFVQATTLPTALSGMAAVISATGSGGYLYVVGGSTGSPVTTISYRAFNAGGTFIDSWIITNALAYPAVYASAVVRNGNLYIIGGFDGYIDDDCVYRFPINADGSLGTRVIETNKLPSRRDSFGATTWTDESSTDHLYVIGGESGSDNTPTSRVPRTTFDSGNAVAAFIDDNNDKLNNSLSQHGAVQSNGRIFLTGGSEGTTQVPITKVYSALIDPTGSLHNWGGTAWIASEPLPRPRRRHATVMNSGGEVYVIGGYGDPVLDANGADTIYHGPTTGFGSKYAPTGKFLSRVINLVDQRAINQIVVNTTITSPVTMTVEYRYGNTPSDFADPNTGWNNLPALAVGINISNPSAVAFTASMVQYRTVFTSTDPYDLSPILSAVQFRYPVPATPTPTATTSVTPPTPTPTATATPVISPDLTILGIVAPNSLGSAAYQTMTIRVANIGNRAFSPGRLVQAPTIQRSQQRAPTFRSTTSQPSSTTRRTAADPYFAWISPYIDRAPTGVTDLGNCQDQSGVLRTPPYVYIGDLPIGTYKDYQATCWLTAGTHSFYAQVDSCDNPSANPDYRNTCSVTAGYVLETNESNNVFGPVDSGSGITQTLNGNFFPYIRKSW